MFGLRLLLLGSVLLLGLAPASTGAQESNPDVKKPPTGGQGGASEVPKAGTKDDKSAGDNSASTKTGMDKTGSTKAGTDKTGTDTDKAGTTKTGETKTDAKVDKPAQAPAEYRVIVRLSYNPGTAALPVVIAQERGFFRREGLVVSAIPVTSQRAVVASLSSGAADFATGSQAWLIDMAQADLPVKVVALNGYERQMELIVPGWEKSVKSVKDLKGKTVLILQGTHNFDAVPELFKILLFNRIRLSQVKIGFFPLSQLGAVFAGNAKAQAAMKRRKIAAFFGYKEHTDYYVKRKLARVVMTNEDIRELLGRNGPRPLFANAKLIKRYPETVQRFVNAWVAAQDYVENNPEDASRLLRLYLIRQYGFTASDEASRAYVQTIRYGRYDWTPQDIRETNINAKMISQGRDILFSGIKDPKKRPFQKPPTVDKYIDNSFVKKAIAKLKEEKEKRAAAAKKTDEASEDTTKNAEKKAATKPDANGAPKDAEKKAENKEATKADAKGPPKDAEKKVDKKATGDPGANGKSKTQ